MADASRDTLRGLLIQDPRLRDESAIWAAESTGLTQAGRQLGRPSTSSTTSLRLEARGDSESALDVLTIAGGIPGQSLGVAWKQDGESATSYRGQDAPVAIRAAQTLALGLGAGVASFTDPDCLTMQDGTVVIVNAKAGTALGSFQQVECRTINSGTGAVSSAVTIASRPYTGQSPYPWLVSVPREDGSERLLCGFWTEDSGTGTTDTCNLDVYYSDDSGTTWSVYARSVLSGSTTIDPATQRDGIDIGGAPGSGASGWDVRRCRAAYANGQILLMMHLVHHDTNRRRVGDFLLQWNSSDLGASFRVVDEPTSLVATEDSAYRGGAPVVRARDGLFEVARVQVSDSNYAGGLAASTITVGIQVDRLGSAVQRFTETGSSDSSAPTKTDGGEVSQVGASLLYTLTDPECALVSMSSGLMAVYWRRPDDGTSGHEVRCAVCTDGVTFRSWGSSMYASGYGTVWDVDSGSPNPLDGGGASGNVDNYPRAFVAAAQGGRVVLATNWKLDGTTSDDSLSVLMLGGYHSQTLGASSPTALSRPDAAVGWEHCWYGLHRPDYVRFTRATTGTPTNTIGIDGMRIQTGLGEAESYTLQPDGSGTEGVRLRWTVKCDTALATSNLCAVQLKVRDGSNILDVSIRFTAGGVTVRDNVAGSAIATESVDMTEFQEFELAAKVGPSSGDLVLYRRPASLQADNLWTVVADVAPTLTASAAALHYIRFGADGPGLSDQTWRDFFVISNNHTGLRFLTSAAIVNPDELAPVALSGRWSELQPGAFVRAVDGPSAPGDAYDLPLSYSYGGERVLPSVLASPAVGWRSTSQSAQSLALAFNPDRLGLDENGPLSDTWGVHLAGINWFSGTLEGYDTGTSSWVQVAALDFETSVSWTRSGNVIELSSATETVQIPEGEFDGGWIKLSSTKRRRIVSTRGGLLTAAGGTVRRPRLVLADVDGTEGASGSGEIAPTSATVIVRDADSYSGLRISIDAQSTPDGYFTIGTAIVGPFVAFGTDYSWGRIIETSYNVELNQARGGQRQPYEVGPSRRTVEVAWTDGIDSTQIDGDSSDADYMLSTTTSGIEPAAYTRAVLYDVRGVLDLLSGPLHPVVYLPRVAKGTPDTETLTARSSAVYGRITSPVRLESILGNEDADEVWRLARLTIEEEV
jgi:hypothetical protein